MSEANLPILRCPQCNKPFDKQTTLKRHGYYCRSRKTGAARVVRSRSCAACAKAKTRCDNRRPNCTRCTGKGIECRYIVNEQHNNARYQSRLSDSVSSDIHLPGVNNASTTISSSHNGDATLDNIFSLPGTETAIVEDLDLLDTDIRFDDFIFSPQTTSEGKTVPFATSMEGFPLDLQQSSGNTQLSVSPLASLLNYSPRTLDRRPRIKPGAQRIADLMFHTLKSYPQMMLQPDNLPPFIHPAWMSEGFLETDHMESLNNCINLMNMFNNRIRGNRKLFWRNVRMECERFCEESSRMNNYELLAAMQALAIYIIIRLDEGETEHNNFDMLLCRTLIFLARKFGRKNITNSMPSVSTSQSTTESEWQEWVYIESRRRLCIVFKIINMLIYFEPSDECDLHQRGLVLAPLPARKQIWEAQDEEAWKIEHIAGPNNPSFGKETADTIVSFSSSPTFGLATNGELVTLYSEQGQDDCGNAIMSLHTQQQSASSWMKTSANWEDWCAGMDGLGGLVLLAASLLE